MNFAKAEHRIYKRFMTRVWILSLMTAMVLTAALGTVAFAEESGEVTLHFIKSWDGIRRAAGVCRYFDLDTGDAIRDRDIVVALIGGTYSFGVPLIEGYAYAGLGAGSAPAEGIMPEGGALVSMLFGKGGIAGRAAGRAA